MKSNPQIYLREMNQSDADSFLEWLNNDDVKKFLNIKRPANKKAQIERMNELMSDKSKKSFVICLKKDNQSIGSISLNNINLNNKSAEMTIFIGEDKYRGRGLGQEAIKLIIEFAFNYLKLNKLSGNAYDFNYRSINSLVRLGFKKEGELENTIYRDNSYHNTILFYLLKSE